MKDAIKKMVFVVMAVCMFAVSACAYAGMASHNGKLYVARNDSFLFGALRAVFVCTDAGGKLQCQKAGSP
jgi:hypothetical protein